MHIYHDYHYHSKPSNLPLLYSTATSTLALLFYLRMKPFLYIMTTIIIVSQAVYIYSYLHSGSSFLPTIHIYHDYHYNSKPSSLPLLYSTATSTLALLFYLRMKPFIYITITIIMVNQAVYLCSTLQLPPLWLFFFTSFHRLNQAVYLCSTLQLPPLWLFFFT